MQVKIDQAVPVVVKVPHPAAFTENTGHAVDLHRTGLSFGSVQGTLTLPFMEDYAEYEEEDNSMY